MLQRIQTVYLLIIMALTIASVLSVAVLQSGDQLFTFDATGISTMAAQPGTYLSHMGIVCFDNRDLFAGSFDYLPV